MIIYTLLELVQSKKILINSNKFKVYKSSRGGQYTYHGPGQKIIYLMLNLRKKGYDIRKFISLIEEWIIKSLQDIDVNAVNDKNHVGIWIKDKNTLKKISSIGLRVRKRHYFSRNKYKFESKFRKLQRHQSMRQ